MGLLRLAAPLRGFSADGALRGVRAAAVVAAKKETGNARSYDARHRAPREPRHGVNTPALLATINVVKETPALAKFQFRATNRWISGTYSESRIESFSGAGGEHKHQNDFRYGADHPAVLVGEDRGPTPIEFLLHGLASCITAGVANVAAARGVTLTSVESRVEGDIDLQGILGLSDTVRNGYERIRTQRHYRRRRTAGEAAPDRRAVARTVGGLRCAHQRCAGGRQRQYTLRRAWHVSTL